MVDKINEVDLFYKGACKGLDKRVRSLESGGGGEGTERKSDMGVSSDDVSDLSR